MSPARQTATLAGGCFWCLEAVFGQLRGVEKVTPGYTGGSLENPSYAAVCAGDSGHAEAVQVEFDPGQITYRDLLTVFFSIHDPTSLNRQGADIGSQYRSAIFFNDPGQKETAEQVLAEIKASGLWPRPPVTELAPLGRFHPAEEYHRDYFARNSSQPYCQMVVAPKVAKFRKQFLEKLKK